VQDFSNGADSVNGIKQMLFRRINGHKEIAIGVVRVDENRRSASMPMTCAAGQHNACWPPGMFHGP
jgi:hypothetical protein